ncbi:TorF family putative porin [Pseudomonas sp. DE0010]|uniref:TorF family putative porin n=1 Tax=Pseudomonas sp. DE0010 TaxID=2584951 RepID=UPI00119F61E8|nr:TorF family putative porin [Pseudomonas sp. DE0010]
MTRPLLVLSAALLFSPTLLAQQIKREVGDFDFTLSTTPSRSMAQGLISPTATGTFHGGLDFSHTSGWYVGQYTPSMGVAPGSTLRVDNYVGYKHHFDSTLGYEIGVIHYSQPNIAGAESHALYGGISIMGSRFGGALRDNPSNRIGTLYADFGQVPLLNADLTVKLAHHRLGIPFTIGDGSQVNGFSDWSMQLSRPWLGLDLNLIYSDSNLTGGGCDAYSGINTYCESVVTLKAQRSFF